MLSLDPRERRSVGEGVPTILPDGLRIAFPEIEAVFELTNFTTRASEDPAAMCTLFRQELGQPARLAHKSKLNLYGQTARTAYVKLLNERTVSWPFAVDWLFVIEQVVELTDNYLAVGEPLVDLWAVEPAPTLPYLFEPLVPDGELCILFGDGGTLKSFLGMLLAISTATGRPIPGLGAPSRVGNILYLDYETNQDTHARRLRALAAGLGATPVLGRILYRQMKRPLHQETTQLRRLIMDRKIVLVIIDSVGMACGGNINDSGDTLKTITALTSLGNCAKFGIGHKNKMDDFIGSVYWRNGPRAMWEVNAEQGAGNTKRVGYIHRKANDDRIREPFAFGVEFEPGGRILFESISPDMVVAVEQRLTAIERVRRGLREIREGTISEIISNAPDGTPPLTPASIRTYLQVLERDQEVVRIGSPPSKNRPQVYRWVDRDPATGQPMLPRIVQPEARPQVPESERPRMPPPVPPPEWITREREERERQAATQPPDDPPVESPPDGWPETDPSPYLPEVQDELDF